MKEKHNIIELVESAAISSNEVFPKYTIITFYNDTSKIKIADGKTKFNDLKYIGGSGEAGDVSWDDISNKPETFAPIIGITATTAKAGNWTQPSVATLTTGRTISVSGAATGTSPAFNGSANVTIPISLAVPTNSVRGGVLLGGVVNPAQDTTDIVEKYNILLNVLSSAGIITVV